jgi:ribosome biogenesis GTPase
VPPLAGTDDEAATVGDWLLLAADSARAIRRLERKSIFLRRAAGHGRSVQLIAANVDTLFIVTSCNQDFNPARLERYLALAHEAGVMPVMVLTKADLVDDAGAYRRAAEALMPGLLVECVNALDPESARPLAMWCGPGQTVALVGSSGVGKSTLVNTLGEAAAQATQDIREDDARGRHTTSGRSMHRLAAGGWLIDTPGMRELQLTGAEAGIGELFADIEDLAAACRFSDCAHEGEPGCAIAGALLAGKLDAERLDRYRKLLAEDRRNTESLAERRSRAKKLGRFYRSAQSEARRNKGE